MAYSTWMVPAWKSVKTYVVSSLNFVIYLFVYLFIYLFKGLVKVFVEKHYNLYVLLDDFTRGIYPNPQMCNQAFKIKYFKISVT